MKTFLSSLADFLKDNLVRLLCLVSNAAGKIADYLENRRKDKLKQQAEKEVQAAEKKVDDACDSGGLDDLFDAAEELKRAKEKAEGLK